MAQLQINRIQQKLKQRQKQPLIGRVRASTGTKDAIRDDLQMLPHMAAAKPGTPTYGPANPKPPSYGPAGGGRDTPTYGPANPGGGNGGGKDPATGLPFDAQYDFTVAGARRDLIAGAADIDYQRQRLGTAYGFDNPAANPYSRAALLTKSYAQQNNGTVNSYAARGQLYAGSAQNQLNANLDNFGQAWNAERGAYEEELRGLTDKNTAAFNSYTDTLGGAAWDALQRAQAVEMDPLLAPEKQKGGKGKGKGGKGQGGKPEWSHEPSKPGFSHKPGKGAKDNKRLRARLRKALR